MHTKPHKLFARPLVIAPLLALLLLNFAPAPAKLIPKARQNCPQAGAALDAGEARPDNLAALDSEWSMHQVSAAPGGPDGVRLADVNYDGLCDVITAYESSGQVRIFQHPGLANPGKPWPAVTVGSVARGEDAMGTDLNADGYIDIVSAHEGDTMAIYIHWAPSDAGQILNSLLWKTVRIPSSQGRGWMFTIAMDVNRDGLMDLVAGAKDDYYNERNSIGEIGWFENPGRGKELSGKWRYFTIDHAGWTMSIFPFDVDGDGHLDLLLTDRNADEEHMGARWLRNPGRDWGREWKSTFFANLAGSSPTFLATGDLNGDGVEELVIPLPDQQKIAILRRNPENDKYRTITPKFDYDLELGTLKSVAIGDVDLDGRKDIIISYVGGEVGLAWISFDRTAFSGTWTFHPIFTITEGKFDLVQLYDVDADGDLDILTTEEQLELGVLWFENPVRNNSD